MGLIVAFLLFIPYLGLVAFMNVNDRLESPKVECCGMTNNPRTQCDREKKNQLVSLYSKPAVSIL